MSGFDVREPILVGQWPNDSPALTIHAVIRNEPFVYYAIKSVYDYADKILLCDTGSDDQITLNAIIRLLQEDNYRKIRFQSLPMEDMTYWRVGTERFFERCEILRSIWNQQIADTATEFFLIVDGDEVHYRDGIRRIVEEVLPNWPVGKIACHIPIRWHTQLCEIVPDQVAPSRVHGRIFRTKDVRVEIRSNRGEIHCDKKTGHQIQQNLQAFTAVSIPAFAHFAAFLKPSAHAVSRHRRLFRDPLPEVMCEDDSFITRYQKKISGSLGAL